MEDCNVSTTFGSQTDFERHLANHALIDAIICPICSHFEQDIHRYKQHFRLVHPSEIMPAAVQPKKVPRNLDTQPCPFCSETPGSRKFVSHVSRHCEEVALSSLSRTFDEDSDEEEREEEEEGDDKITKPNDHNGMHRMGVYADMIIDGPEIGTLIVIVDRAKNLPNWKHFGKQELYCVARLGKEVKKTENDRGGGQTPIWYVQ
jgi:hypothetical protein